MSAVVPIGDTIPQTFTPISRADTDSWINVVSDVVKFANIIAETEFVPRSLRGSAPATAAAMLYGREVGLPPMTALGSTHVVDGRPAISAEAMRALVFAAGHEIVFDVTTGAECSIRGRRRGSDTWAPVTWSLAMARAAGLLNRDSWKRYPRAMLVARATVELCRMIFPDVIHGFAAVEELDGDLTAVEPPEAPTPRRTPVRRRRAPVASDKAAPRPAQPVQAGEETGPLLPGDPGYENPSASDSHDGTRNDADNAVASTGAKDDRDESGGGDTLPPPDSHPDDPDQPPLPLDEPEPVDEPKPRPPVAPRMISRPQQRMMLAVLGDLGVESHDDRVDVLTVLCGRKVESSKAITADEASKVLDTLAHVVNADQLAKLCSELIANASRAET